MSSAGLEDVVLRDLFAVIGTTNRFCVECGARDGVGWSNTHRLRNEDGWAGLLLDARPRASNVVEAHLTAENISDVFATHGVPEEFDLLSIDVDGNDFYLWKALEAFRARVVVIEYNPMFGPDDSLVIAYRADHRWDKSQYFGASARALTRLGREKGYVLAAVCEPNLVFVTASAGVHAVDLPAAVRTDLPAGRARQWERV